MYVVRWCLVALLGCGRIGFQPLEDAPVPVGDLSPFAPFGGFANPVDLGVLDASDPQLSADGLSLWMTLGGSTANSSIGVLVRPTTADAFGPEMTETTFDS